MINGEVLCSKKEILRSLKYTRDQDPREFVSTIRDALRIVKPGFTSSELCEKVLDRLPVKMARKIEDLGVTSQLYRILGVMIRSHEDYLEREKAARKVKLQGRSNDYGRKMFKHKGSNKYLQGRPKEDTINHQGYKNSYNLRPNRMSDLTCLNCNRKGHTKEYCWVPKKEGQNSEDKKKEEVKNHIIRKQTSQGEDDAFRNVFDVNKGKENLESGSTKDPCVKVSIIDESREKVDELKALIDTGSHVSLTSREYAIKREWRIFETNTKIFGIDHQNIEIVGVTYIMVVPEGDTIGTLIKLIVAENSGEQLLLGQDFHKKLGIIVAADENGYTLRQKKEN